MTASDARRYLVRIAGLQVAALIIFIGMLLGVLDAAAPGVGLMALGFAGFAWAVCSATVEAVRRRSPGQPLVGPDSVYADMNRLTSWWYVAEATDVLGMNAARVQRFLARLAVATVLAFVAVPVVAVATK